jgi:predicted nuclease with TOPRIM domain
MKGDGTKQRYLTRLGRKFRERKSVFYAGTNYRLADQFQELCLKLNIRAIISGNNPRNIRVCVSERYPYHYIKKRNILLSNYKGLTWDITVPNGTFVARRNGRPFITGNCPEKGTFKSVSKQAILKLAKKGGKRGLGAIFVTQRPAFLSKYAISQCVNKIIGHMEWPSDLKVIQDFLRVPKPIVDKISQLEQGCFYVAGEFVDKQGFVKVGPVQTKHLGATPEVVPPAPAELERVVSRMREELPKIIEEKLAPAVPKVSEIEAKVREKLEAAYLAKLQRLEKEREALKKKLEAKFEAEKAELCKRYETEIAELRKKYEEAVRQATLKGRTTDLLSHPLVQRNLAKLNDKERHLIEILETKGPQDANRIAFALGVSPSYVPTFVYKINEKIPNLVRSVDGKYVSMLARLFPVTEELQAEARESERLRAEVEKLRVELDRLRTLAKDLSEKLANAMTENNQLRGALKLKTEEVMKLMARVRELENRIKEIETAKPVPIAVRTEPAVEQTVPKQPTVVAPPEQVVPVEVRLKRVVTDVSITTDKEVLEADEKTMIGKILARGLEGFFDQPRTLGEVMKELERRYALSSSSGGTRQSATNALEELVSKGILDRREENGQWVYFATPSFRERVKGK